MVTKPLLLFLCTGNYYRSRFVEVLFNHLAAQAALAWQAESRGIALELGVNNRGPISGATLEALQARGIVPVNPVRFPQQVQEEDFIRARRIIALDEAEHRPLLAHRFSQWLKHVEFWQISDVPRTPAAEGIARMATQVQELIQTLTNTRI
ncbi:MAG: low molecular weight phosphatase family protein [Candidatus Binatia bacterium]